MVKKEKLEEYFNKEIINYDTIRDHLSDSLIIKGMIPYTDKHNKYQAVCFSFKYDKETLPSLLSTTKKQLEDFLKKYERSNEVKVK